MHPTIKPDPATALALVSKGITLTAFSVQEDGRRVPWTKGWSELETLPIHDEKGIMSCIESGCWGFQFRAIDAGLSVVDIDRKGGKDGLKSLEQSAKLHNVKLSSSIISSGYVVMTPNDGCHIYLKPDDWIQSHSLPGIIEGVDLLSDRSRLVIVAGSVGIHKESGEHKIYQPMGHMDNIPPMPESMAGMFKRIYEAREAQKEEQRKAKLQAALERKLTRPQYENGTLFEEAKNRVNTTLINTLFSAEGSEWRQSRNGMELFTLNPLRSDNSVGSFSIREDGVYSDFADSSCSGDFIDLLCGAYNMTPLEAARMIVRETGGNPADYDGKRVENGITVRIGKSSITIGEDYQVKEDEKEQHQPTSHQDSKPDKPKDSHGRALFPLKRLCEFNLDEEEWLIDRLFQADSLALTYGKPGSGKSFWTLDLSLCIATGKEFNGNEVKQGPVVYLAGEGHKGIYKRALAWQKHHGIDASDSPWWLAGRPFDLIDCMSTKEVLEAIDYHAQGVSPSLVVIDTLARNFGAGDENKASDMGQVIRNADAIRVKYGCLVIIVHHSGHESDRARGSSSLKAAMDFEYYVNQPEENVLLVTNTRMKDGEKPKDMSYRLTDIDLGKKHKWGDPIISAVLVPEEIDTTQKPRKKTEYLGENQKHVLSVLITLYDKRKANLKEEFMDDSGAMVPKSELVDTASKDKEDRSNVYKIIKALVAKGLVTEIGNDLIPVIG